MTIVLSPTIRPRRRLHRRRHLPHPRHVLHRPRRHRPRPPQLIPRLHPPHHLLHPPRFRPRITSVSPFVSLRVFVPSCYVAPHLPSIQHRILQQHPHRRLIRNHQPKPPIQKTPLQKIILKKRQPRPRDQIQEPRPLPSRPHRIRQNIRMLLHPPPITKIRRHKFRQPIMQKRRAQLPHNKPRLRLPHLRRTLLRPRRPLLMNQPRLKIRRPAPHIPLRNKILPRHLKNRHPRHLLLPQPQNLLPQPRGNLLIRIQHHHPLIHTLRCRKLPLRVIPPPPLLHYPHLPRRMPPRQLHRPIRRPRIHHHNLFAPSERVQRQPNPMRLVLTNNTCRNSRHGGEGKVSAAAGKVIRHL